MLVIYIALIALIIYTIDWLRFISRYPPGPLPLPFVGNLPHIYLGTLRYGGIVDLMKVWQQKTSFKKYGNVLTIWMGSLPTVHIMDYETAKAEMVTNGSAYADRYPPYMLNAMRDGKGVIFSSGDFWIDHRRFVLRTLRNFALKNSVMEERIMHELRHNFKQLAEKTTTNEKMSLNAYDFFNVLVGGVINRIIFSEDLAEENIAEFFAVKRGLDEESLHTTALAVSLEKWMIRLPFMKNMWKKLTLPQKRLVDFISRRLSQRKQAITSGKHYIDVNCKDFLDAYLWKIEQDRREERHPTRSYNEDVLIYDIYDLWMAGQETTAITLMWGFMHLIKNPKEIQRMASILSLNLWRRTKEDSYVCGHFVPKGTAIAAEISVIMSDKKYFRDCHKFNPDRYEEGGKQLEQRVVPFGLGKRSCIGETLAKAELYLVIANMILNYDIQEDPEAPIDLRTSTPTGIEHRPRNFRMLLSAIRNQSYVPHTTGCY